MGSCQWDIGCHLKSSSPGAARAKAAAPRVPPHNQAWQLSANLFTPDVANYDGGHHAVLLQIELSQTRR
jgi:hypothetical protein